MNHILSIFYMKINFLRIERNYFKMGIYNTFPDFHSEEVTIIKKNKEDLNNAVEDMAEHLPKEDPGKG